LLPTHVSCNAAYKSDEEYFVVSLVGHHLQSESARSVWADVRRGAAKGHSIGLIRTIISQFGEVVLPNWTGTFAPDGARVRRVAWKLARGLYTLNSRQLPPESQLYKWLGLTDGTAPLHLLAFLLSDELIGLVVFHDPLCRCERCIQARDAA
jgi:hypothetical protein